VTPAVPGRFRVAVADLVSRLAAGDLAGLVADTASGARLELDGIHVL
jgi:hypothetical protein